MSARPITYQISERMSSNTTVKDSYWNFTAGPPNYELDEQMFKKKKKNAPLGKFIQKIPNVDMLRMMCA